MKKNIILIASIAASFQTLHAQGLHPQKSPSIQAADKMTCRVVQTGKENDRSWKMVEVNYNSGGDNLIITFSKGAREGPSKRSFGPNEKGSFTFKTFSEDYRVSASVNGQEIDEETSRKKTGL